MKIDYRTAIWKGRSGRLWRLTDKIEAVAQAIRDANKPYDLVYPTTVLMELVNETKRMQWEWLEERMKLDKADRGNWPKL